MKHLYFIKLKIIILFDFLINKNMIQLHYNQQYFVKKLIENNDDINYKNNSNIGQLSFLYMNKQKEIEQILLKIFKKINYKFNIC